MNVQQGAAATTEDAQPNIVHNFRGVQESNDREGMERREINTLLPSSSNIDSGVAVNTFGSSASQIELDESAGAHMNVQQDVAAPTEDAQPNIVHNFRGVQESNDREGMERREINTLLPSSSNIDSGVAVNTFGSSASQIELDESAGAHMNVQQGAAAPTEDAQPNIVHNFRGVQESNDREGDVDLHPPAMVVFRYDGERIISQGHGDVDIQNARVALREFKQFLRFIGTCRTCNIRRRVVINYPCLCFCNCLDCAQFMSVCSMCYSRIDFTVQVVFQYESH